MRYIKTFENNDEKCVIIYSDPTDVNDISVSIESEEWVPFSFSNIETLEEDNYMIRYYTQIEARKQLRMLMNKFKNLVFKILTIDEFELLVNAKKYNL